MDINGLRTETIQNIRSCLISFKGKMSIRQLECDYRTILGERIPYSKLGYKKLEDFLGDIPSLFISKTSQGEWFIDAKASEKSSHITDMVNKQKSSKRAAPRSIPRAINIPRFNKAPQTSNWRPSNINLDQRRIKKSNRTSIMSHNQIVCQSPKKEQKVQSRVVVPESSTLRRWNKPVVDASNSSNNVKATVNNNSVSAMKKEEKINTPNPTPTYTTSTPKRHIDINDTNHNTKSPVDLETFANYLTSRRKIITKMMSEMSLERDSGNSSPTYDLKEIQIPVFNLTDDPVADLYNMAEFYKLGDVEITVKPIIPKKRYEKILYTCTIKIDGQTYISYPNDFYNEKSSKEFCAKQALEQLTKKFSQKKTLLLANSIDIKKRIPPMLKPHFHGIWKRQIEAQYIEQYMEQLPPNWLEVIDSCDCVVVQKVHSGFVLQYCRPGTKGDTVVQQIPIDISIPSNTVQFGETNRLYASITCFMSLNEVWCHQWDTTEFQDFSHMIARMETYYNENKNKHKALDIHLGSYYVANYESNWYRIRVLEVKDNSVNCFLVDYGDEYTIEKDNLYQLQYEFGITQAQAFVCRLAGLEDLYETNVSLEKLSSYVGKELILEASQNLTDDADSDQTIAVIMYDFVSGKSINEELLKYFTIETAIPILRLNTIEEVTVSHIFNDGDVYVYINSKPYENLQTLLKNLEVEFEKNNHRDCIAKIDEKTWESSKDCLYIIKDITNKRYCRVKITDWSPNGGIFAQVFFVDVGKFEVVKLSETIFYRISMISDVLYQLPYQAVRIKMALEKVPEKFVEYASKVISCESPVLLKIIDYDNEKIPIGEFYKRSNDDGLFCINKSIVMETELNKSNEKSCLLKGAKIKLDKLLKDEALHKDNVPSGGSLLCPKLPTMGNYFEVHIPFTVNPWNFFVQPYSTSVELNNLMKSLQQCYKNKPYSPLSITDIRPGQIYASQYSDGIWYRISVLKVIHSGSISVFFCDFGYYFSLRLDQLVPLDCQFTTLPYQALKAKLSGIKPKNNKWSMEDCEYFTNLVVGKPFVSILEGIEKDELYESDPVLKLKLIDTSTDEDIDINLELIKKNIAIDDPKK